MNEQRLYLGLNGGNPHGALPRPFTRLRPGKGGNRQWPHHGAVIGSEPDDDQIVFAQVRQLTGRRDEFHRLLASLLRKQAVSPELSC